MGNARLKKLDFKEINKRWSEFKELSKKALNDEKNPTDLGDNFEIAMARFFLLCQSGNAQVWISSEDENECYLCFSFIGNSLLSHEKGLTIYSVVKFNKAFVVDREDHWTNALREVFKFAKVNHCKNIYIETDLDYLVDMFKKSALPFMYQVRNSLRVKI